MFLSARLNKPFNRLRGKWSRLLFSYPCLSITQHTDTMTGGIGQSLRQILSQTAAKPARLLCSNNRVLLARRNSTIKTTYMYPGRKVFPQERRGEATFTIML